MVTLFFIITFYYNAWYDLGHDSGANADERDFGHLDGQKQVQRDVDSLNILTASCMTDSATIRDEMVELRRNRFVLAVFVLASRQKNRHSICSGTLYKKIITPTILLIS